MADVTNKRVVIYIDQAAAEVAMNKLQKKADGFNQKIEDARKKQAQLNEEIVKAKDAGSSLEGLKTKYAELKSNIEVTVKAQEANAAAIKSVKESIKDYSDRLDVAKEKQAQLSAEILKAEEAGKSTVRLQTQYKSLDSEITVLNKRVIEHKDSLIALQSASDKYTTSITEARQKQKLLNEEIKQAKQAGESTKALERDYNDLQKVIDSNEKSLEKLSAEQKKLSGQIDQNLGPTLNQQKNLVKQLNAEIAKLPVNTEAFGQKLIELRNAEGVLDELKTKITGVEKAQNSWFQEAKVVAFGVLIGNTVQSAIQAVGSYLSGLVSGNGKLADSLKDVEKATGKTSAEVGKLNSDLGKIDTRTATSDLREIAIGLGQINEEVSKNSVAAIDKIVVALGDEFGGGAREITTELSVLRNNLQDIKSGNYGDDVLHLGNALNVLGAEGLATAPVVTDIANRVAGIASTFKITSGQILGTAATFQELGIETERGATAYTKILQKIAAEPEKFAKVAGVPVKEFTNLVNTDMQAAFVKVAEGARIAGSNNVLFAQTLKELDADGSGAGEVLSKIGANADLLKNKMDLATTALKNSDSIVDEFSKKNSGLGAELDKLSKSFNSFIQSKTLADVLSAGVSTLNNFIAALKAVPQWLKENQTGIYLIVAGLALMNASYIKAGALIVRDTALKVINAATTKATALATDIAIASEAAYIQITTLLTGRITLATAAQRLWNIALSLGAGPIGIIIVAVGALAVGLNTLINNTKRLTAEQKLNADIQKSVIDSTTDEISRINTLKSVVQDSNVSLENRKKVLQALIAISPEYLKGLTLENITTQEGKKILDDYITSLQAKAEFEAKAALLADKLQQRDEIVLTLRTNFDSFKKQSLEQIEKFSLDAKKAAEKNEFLGIGGKAKIGDVDITELAQTFEQIKILQKDVSDAAKKNITDLVSTTTNGVNDSAKAVTNTIGDLKKQIQGLDTAFDDIDKNNIAAIRKNRDERKKLQDELDRLEGKQRKSSTPYDSLLKEAEAFNKKLLELKFQAEQASKTQDQREIDAIKNKYDEILKEYLVFAKKLKNTPIKLALSIGDINGQEAKEIKAKLLEQGQKNFAETAKKEYAQTIAETDRFYAELKQKQAQSFVDGEIDKKQFEANVAAIDVAAKQAQIRNAQDYSAAVEAAAADVTKFQKQELQKQVDDLIAANEKKLANQKLLNDLDNEAKLSRARTQVKLAPPGTNEELKAKINLIQLEHQLDVQALEQKRRELLLSIDGQYEQELRLLKAHLEDMRRVELAAIKTDDPQAETKKAEVNKRFDNSINEAEIAAAKEKGAALVKINDDINSQLKDADDQTNSDIETTTNEFIVNKIQGYLQYAQQALGIVNQFSQARTDAENKAFDRELKQNDVKKVALKRQLDAKLISEQEFKKRVYDLDAEADQKKQALEKKQFERNKKMQIAQAIMNGALAITSILAQYPKFDFGIAAAIAMGVAAATTAAEVAIIAKTKFGRGGKTSGPSHAEQGLPVINPITGQKVAELEGEEGILKKSAMRSNQTYTVTGTPSEITSTLNNRYGGVKWDRSATIKPVYKTREYRTVNHTNITRTITRLKFAEGGVFGAAAVAANNQPATDPALLEVMKQNNQALLESQAVNAELMQTVTALNGRLSKPIKADVSLHKIQDAEDQQQRILSDATFQ